MSDPVVYIDESDEDLLETMLREREQIYEMRADLRKRRQVADRQRWAKAARVATQAPTASTRAPSQPNGVTAGTSQMEPIDLVSSQSDCEVVRATSASTVEACHTESRDDMEAVDKAHVVADADEESTSVVASADTADTMAVAAVTRTLDAMAAAPKQSLRRILGIVGENVTDSSGRVLWRDLSGCTNSPSWRRSVFPVRLPPSGELSPTTWPDDVGQLCRHFNSMGLRFPREPPFGRCGCDGPCRVDTYKNGRLSIFCAPNCCSFLGRCGNGFAESNALQLATKDNGARTVVAAKLIPDGVVVGEYFGEWKLRPADKRRWEPNNGYHFVLTARADGHPRSQVFIDAKRLGGMTRFMNHSCDPAAVFYQVSNGDQHTVVVATVRPVQRGEKVTVDYSDALWFLCECGEPKCCHRDIHVEIAIKNELKVAVAGTIARSIGDSVYQRLDTAIFRFAGLNVYATVNDA